MSGTVYLKIEKNVQIHSRIVSFKDIAQIVADDSALENKIRVLKLPPDTDTVPPPLSLRIAAAEFPSVSTVRLEAAREAPPVVIIPPELSAVVLIVLSLTLTFVPLP